MFATASMAYLWLVFLMAYVLMAYALCWKPLFRFLKIVICLDGDSEDAS